MVVAFITLYLAVVNFDFASGFNPSRRLLGVTSNVHKEFHNYINIFTYSNSAVSNSILYAHNSINDTNLPLKGQQLQSTYGPFNNLKVIIPFLFTALVAIGLSQSGIVKLPEISSLLESVVSKIESLGPYGYLYFSLVGTEESLRRAFLTHICTYALRSA